MHNILKTCVIYVWICVGIHVQTTGKTVPQWINSITDECIWLWSAETRDREFEKTPKIIVILWNTQHWLNATMGSRRKAANWSHHSSLQGSYFWVNSHLMITRKHYMFVRRAPNLWISNVWWSCFMKWWSTRLCFTKSVTIGEQTTLWRLHSVPELSITNHTSNNK